MAAKKPRRMATPRASIPLNHELDRRAREVLINARLAANLTQQELAARLGRAQSFVSRIEGGSLAIEREHFAAIARALGKVPRALFAKAIIGPIECGKDAPASTQWSVGRSLEERLIAKRAHFGPTAR